MKKLVIALMFAAMGMMSFVCLAQDAVLSTDATVAVTAVAAAPAVVEPMPTEWLSGIIVPLGKTYPVILVVLSVLGLVLVVVQVVVLITPTKKDDEFINKKIKGNSIFLGLWNFILSFAPIQKTPDGLKLSKQ